MLRYLYLAVVVALFTTAIIGALAEDFNPGLQIGQILVPFRLPDQNGRLQDFSAIKGPKGLALLFFRSADW
jgi:hypothetical protein